MRRPLRAVWLWVTAVIVAVTTAVFVANDLAVLHRRASALGPERPVVVARRDLALGAVVRMADLATVDRHASQVPDDALDDPGAAVGRTVTVPVLEGHVVGAEHLAPRDRRGTAGVVAPGMRAVRVPDPAGLAPPPGAVVDVIVALDATLAEQVGATTLVPAAGARVLATGGPAGDRDDAPDAASVLLLVPEQDAQRLAFAVANGSVTLALAPPEDACCATSFSGSSRG